MLFQTSLRDYGRDSLGKEFRQMLNRHSKPVPVEMILTLIETEQGYKSIISSQFSAACTKTRNT